MQTYVLPVTVSQKKAKKSLYLAENCCDRQKKTMPVTPVVKNAQKKEKSPKYRQKLL